MIVPINCFQCICLAKLLVSVTVSCSHLAAGFVVVEVVGNSRLFLVKFLFYAYCLYISSTTCVASRLQSEAFNGLNE